jgi:hypothetical protein
VIYELDSELLTRVEDKQSLARLLAVQSAAQADLIEREIQAKLRAIRDERPEPNAAVLAGVEADKTPYVPGQKGRRRVVALNPTPKPLGDTDSGTFGSPPEPSSTVSEPKPRTGFFACLWKRLKSFFA